MSITDTPPHPDDGTRQLPIVIAGGGCVGLFLALLLAHTGIPSAIIVLEPRAPDPTATRAMAHQPPTYPLLSAVPGLLPELVAAGSLSSGLCFRSSVEHGSRVIAEKTFENREGAEPKAKGQLLLPQGRFQEVLMGRLRGLGSRAEVRVGWEVVGFRDEADRVVVRVRDGCGTGEEEQEIEAAYLVGADGAHSAVRKMLGVKFEGETLDAQLVATDIRFDFNKYGFYDANFVIDPVNYGLIGRIDAHGLWRVSYGVPVGLSEEEVQAGVEEKLKAMLPNGGLDEDGKIGFDIMRVAPYKAQQRCAESFWKGRVGLVGDAAHCKPPALPSTLLHHR
jgi:2-polyprenyl-6-methoxyphenol hydroxylase-like FAD-dependent oxidoreductase